MCTRERERVEKNKNREGDPSLPLHLVRDGTEEGSRHVLLLLVDFIAVGGAHRVAGAGSVENMPLLTPPPSPALASRLGREKHAFVKAR